MRSVRDARDPAVRDPAPPPGRRSRATVASVRGCIRRSGTQGSPGKETGMPILDATTQLPGSLAGVTLRPDDPGFADARAAAVWNGDISRQPALIVAPTSSAQVAAALALPRGHGADRTVSGGGHGS